MDTQPAGSSGADEASGAAREQLRLARLLLDACARLDHAAVSAALVLGPPLEVHDAIGRTPLGIAAAHGDLDLVRMLLDAGADSNASAPGKPAAGLGPAAARRLAARTGDEFRTPLSLAVESGALEVVSQLVSRGASPYTGGATNPLELSILSGDAEMVRVLLDAGGDPNARDSDADTPLMLAAAAGLVEPIEALLEYGAIVSALNDDRESALDVAARCGRADAVALLADHFPLLARMRARRSLARTRGGAKIGPGLALARMDRLHEDARHGRLTGLRKGLAAGVDPDAQISPQGDTALGLAALGGHVSIVRTLLAAGADPNLRKDDETPLLRALAPQALDPRSRPDVVRALVSGGASLDQADGDGLTPLMRAVVDSRGSERTVSLLVSLGADVEAEHPSGMTALDLAKADPAKASLAKCLESLIGKPEESTPSTLGLAAPPTLRPSSSRAAESLRGLGNAHTSEVVLAVRAPIDSVAPALERIRAGRQWSRKVYDEQGFFPGEEGYLLYQFRGHEWTLAQTDLLDRRALHGIDARSLSKQLECDAVLFEVCEASDVLRYAFYRDGRRVEEFGAAARRDTAFDSTLREVAAADRESPLEFIDRSFADWGLFVPGLGDDRLEVLARDFEPGDFERVDFLRIDEA